MNFSEQYPELAKAAKMKHQTQKNKQEKRNPLYSETNLLERYQSMSKMGNIPKPKI